MPDRDETQRPVHLVHDLQSGTSTYYPMTDEEWDEHERRAAESARLSAERENQVQSDLQTIRERAQQDPAFAALMRQSGVQL